LIFAWNANTELDFSYYEIRDGSVWENARLLATDLTANRYTETIGATRTSASFLIKARDTSGNWSLNATRATLNVYSPLDGDVLSIPEKKELALEWAIILAEQERLTVLANQYGANMSAYNAAVAAVPAFFSTRRTPYAWTDLGGSTYLGIGGRAMLNDLLKAIKAETVRLQAELAMKGMAHDIASDVTDAIRKTDLIDPATGQVLWTKLEAAFQKLFAKEVYIANYDNLIPNPNSELPTPSYGWPAEAKEGLGVVTGNAHAGDKCRYVPPNSTLILTKELPAGEGDQYYFDAMVRGSGGRIAIHWNNSASAAAWANSTLSGYNLVSCSTGKASNSTTSVSFRISATGSTGIYFDNLYARKMADGKLIVDGAITANHINSVSIETHHLNAGIIEANHIKAKSILADHLNAGIIKAEHLEAVMSILGVLQSPNYQKAKYSGSVFAAPVGFKLAGQTFDATFQDGTESKVQLELGDNVSIAGKKAATLVDLAMLVDVCDEDTTYGTNPIGGELWQCDRGFVKLRNKLLIQWGREIGSTAGRIRVNMLQAYRNINYAVVCNPVGGIYGQVESVYILEQANSTFTIQRGAGNGFTWTAMGFTN
jgi:hypothetical protein